MSIRRVIALAGVLVAVAGSVSVALVRHWQGSQPTSRGLAELAVAVQRYSADRASAGTPLPSTVTLRELVSGGYMPAEALRAFEGMEVTIYPKVRDDGPEAVLMRVRMLDGEQIVVRGDGSVAALPR